MFAANPEQNPSVIELYFTITKETHARTTHARLTPAARAHPRTTVHSPHRARAARCDD